MNLVTNLETLLTESQSYFEAPTKESGKVILTVRQEVIANPDTFKEFILFFNLLKKRLGLEQYIQQNFLTNMTQVPGVDHPLPLCDKIQYQVDTLSLHIDRLRSFFCLNITKEQVTESMGILTQNGWTEKQFIEQFSLSRATYFRYLPKKDTVKDTQPQSTEAASPEAPAQPAPQNN